MSCSHMGGSVPGAPTNDPERESDFVNEGSSLVPIAINPPGVATSTVVVPAWRPYTSASSTSVAMPGLISISSPTLSCPHNNEPPMTPPTKFSGAVPGLLTSKERAIYMRGGFSRSLGGVGMTVSTACINISIFTECIAETGIMGAFSAIVPLTNFFISLQFSITFSLGESSILFCTMTRFLIPQISSPIKCSFV